MRVLIIDKTGGLETARERFVQLARYSDVELHVLAPRHWMEHGLPVDAAQVQPAGYTLHTGRVGWKGYYARGFYVTGLLRAFARSRPDIVHLLEEPWSFFAWQAVWAARLLAPRSKLIFYTWENIYRDFNYPSRISFLQRRIDRRLHRRSAAAMCATEQARSVLELKGFQGTIEVIPYGVDTPFLAERIEPALPPGGGPFRLGYVGRFLKMKGLDILIESLSRVGDCELVLIGAGDWEEPMRAMIAKKGLEKRVRILSPLPRDKVPSYLASLDALVLPSRTTEGWMEQLGRVMLEAMAVGVPVIGSESGAIPEVLGEAGLLYPEDTAYALAKCVESLRDDPALRAELIRRGKQRIAERYNWRRFADDTYQLYQNILSV